MKLLEIGPKLGRHSHVSVTHRPDGDLIAALAGIEREAMDAVADAVDHHGRGTIKHVADSDLESSGLQDPAVEVAVVVLQGATWRAAKGP